MENETGRLRRIEERLDALEKMLAIFEDKAQSDLVQISKKLSIKEFILSKKPVNDVQRALAISYYLEKYGGQTPFNAKDITAGFRAAKEPVPDNVADKIAKNVGNGHMMEAEEKKDKHKTWTLTSSGERFVESAFKEEVRKSTKQGE